MDQGQLGWDRTIPTSPPMMEAERGVGPVADRTTTTERVFGSSLRGRAARVVGLTALAVVGVFSFRHFTGDSGSDAIPAASADANGGAGETCPDGMFPEGAYQATEQAFADQLHVAPETPLTDTESLEAYLFGNEPGVACRSTETLAALAAGYADLLGAGNVGRSFETTDMNALAQTYKDNPAKAEQAAQTLQRAYGMSETNNEPISGPFFRVAVEETGNPADPYKIVYVPEAVDARPDSVFVVTWNMIINDGDLDAANKEQKILIDRATGQIYFAKAIGAEVKQDQLEDQAQNPDQQEGGQDSQGTQVNGSGGGEGGGKGKTEGGSCPFCGSPTCGGECQRPAPSGGGEGGPKPPKPPVTAPPATTPPTTKPPVTVPPTTPPTTTPPTTQPKGSEVTIPGAPS